MRLLVAYDGSDCADAALADLRRAGLPREVEALVFAVGEAFLPPHSVSSYEVVAGAPTSSSVTAAAARSQTWAAHALDEARKVAVEGRELLRTTFPGWEVLAEAAAGAPAWAVIEKAEQWQADLIVVGTHGRSALGRLLLGSVSARVAADARKSVRVARCPENKFVVEAPIRLLIGYDGSPSARAALRAVARRKWPAGSTARVVAVSEYPAVSSIVGLIPAAAATLAGRANEMFVRLREGVEAAQEDLGAVAGLHVSGKVLTGDPRRVLIEEAERSQADCVFVGSRGTGGPVERFVLGSVSSALVKNAPCTVEVVRG
jgi:nucleotide-binding universal stress UspA family protein